ncbi:hypothetical protein G7062_03005 [Erysipelothrix sp. HDW6C]|uniref:hypothetical protein n=1 Tax=Erysipelothrix sp. HDW6C TaxID=2714930 RepID=UPI00140E38B4|nr:hypothetical protein [Erysipelothrix sp. HDW6C]QIK69324.1 hypothetical protein G7062_03005 [Erysipelothrix sp. HDW6C]
MNAWYFAIPAFIWVMFEISELKSRIRKFDGGQKTIDEQLQRSVGMTIVVNIEDIIDVRIARTKSAYTEVTVKEVSLPWCLLEFQTNKDGPLTVLLRSECIQTIIGKAID